MKPITIRYLSQEDIIGMKIPYMLLIDAAEASMVAHAKGLTECPPKPGVFPRERSFLHAMPAYIKGAELCGIKWVAGYPGNRDKDIPVITGILVLNDPDTGIPLAIMDCRWITAVRTAAVSAVTARHAKPIQSETLTIIGAGVQSRWNLLFLHLVAPELKKCFITDIHQGSIDAFIADMSPRVPGISIERIESDQLPMAIRKSQIVLTATQNLSEPIVAKDMIHSGTLAIALESKAWDPAIYLDDTIRFICDDWPLVQSYQKKGAFSLGLPHAYHLLGNIASGDDVGRANEEEFVISFNMGISVTDMAFAAIILERAEKLGIGQQLPLMESDDLMY